MTATSVDLNSSLQTSITNIEADTGELQANQSNFITATGFLTDTQNNASHGTGTYTTATGYLTDTQMNSSHGSGTYTTATGFLTDAQNNASHGTGTYTTATGFSTSTQLTNLANITVAEIDLQLNQSHEEGNWSAIASTGITVAQIDAQLNASHSTGNWSAIGSSSGTTPTAVWQYILNSTNLNQSSDQAGAILWAIERYMN